MVKTQRHGAQSEYDDAAENRGNDREANRKQGDGEQTVSPVQEINDQGCAGQGGADTRPVQDIEALQPFQHASENPKRKAQTHRGPHHQQQ